MRVMALDWGARRIGIAVSDEAGAMALGLPTMERTNVRRDLDGLAEMIKERDIETVVVGEPLHMDGSASRSSNLARRFARRLAKRAGVEVRLLDERLTSWEARELAGRDRQDRGATDRTAAILLLESYLAARRP